MTTLFEGIEIEDLGGSVPVEGQGRIAGRPFYFRARHDSWSLAVADDPAGDPMEARFGREPGWFRDESWSCAALPQTVPPLLAPREMGLTNLEECDHAHCAGYMPNVVARDLIVRAGRRLLAGEPSAAWTEPAILAAMRTLEAGLAAGTITVVERERGWYTEHAFVPVESSPAD